MIKISNLVYLYKNRKVVDISKLIIKQGEKIAIVGLNGAGKTTLVEIILKLKKLMREKLFLIGTIYQMLFFKIQILFQI
ncbi:ATP-binding cassette domain-containing protein [Spiroplasma cantharicola]|uniref:ATP-binding cassette domain-containing protein n=1 Tax=Spiroplasma cantharicola TaxID=362837 RepID=UPI0006B56FCF|nr:ATP-binding cassette domain-containing protein [Spiroplasma cantharicola]